MHPENGVYIANFYWEISSFIAPRLTSLNPRMCFALRPAGFPDEPYDILYKSMLTWDENKWYKKDGLTDDPIKFCRTAWDDVDAEII